jgi:hypothetical protein
MAEKDKPAEPTKEAQPSDASAKRAEFEALSEQLKARAAPPSRRAIE